MAQLCQHFAADHISDAELEARLDRANAATTMEALRELVSDLPVPGGPAPGVSAGPVLAQGAPLGTVPDTQMVMAVMGGACRKGPWIPPRQLNVVAVMGEAELDFRQARFGPGVTDITVYAVMGSVRVIVPPGLYVEITGSAIMGAFDDRSHGHPPTDPSAPVLRIGGVVFMSAVEIRVRHPGESASDARRREKLERKEMKRLSKGDWD